IRRIARGEFPHDPDDSSASDPTSKVVSIKLYCVRPHIIAQSDFAEGGDPYDDALNMAFYQGEFRPDGTLINKSDPFMHWLIPIIRTPDGVLHNYVNDHATTDYNQFDREKPAEEK